MEFGILVQATLLGARAHDPIAEHQRLLDDLAIVRAADKYGIKYAWVSEHHGLEEFSHMSASESFIPYSLAQTRNIHVGAGIWPLNPQANHPVRLAERAAMCDQLSEGRFEFGTGRGAGSHEIGIFGLDHDQTRENWAEVIWEFRKMWSAGDYAHQGKAFSVPPCRIYPKPYGGTGTHPPMWLAVGSPTSFGKAGEHGLGVLGFGFVLSGVAGIREYLDAYKEGISRADPVGLYVNDNFMMVNGILCLEDPRDARDLFVSSSNPRLGALMYRYHDTFPRPDNFPQWPWIPPAMTRDQAEQAIAGGLPVGSPEEVIAALQPFADIGVDQVAFSLPPDLPLDVCLEIVRTIGEKVVPHFDRDPIHRTSYHRYGKRAAEMVGKRAGAGSNGKTLADLPYAGRPLR